MAAGARTIRVFLRLDIDGADSIGPGKIRLLGNVRDLGSISTAARAMKMSYCRAWLLIESLNGAFKSPVVVSAAGGKRGGGAVLTPAGARLVARYRGLERAAEKAGARELRAVASAARARGVAPLGRCDGIALRIAPGGSPRRAQVMPSDKTLL